MTKQTKGISRRHALQAAGLAAAGGLAGFSRPGLAAAPQQALIRPEIYRFRLGDFEVTTFLDGAIRIPKSPHPIFGRDQPAEKVHELAQANFLPPDKFEATYIPVLVNTGKELVLFDSGNGPLRRGKGAGHLAELMKKSGYAPEQVDKVVITHCHPDHFGGLMEGDKPGFVNAEHVFGAKEFDYWKKGDNIRPARKKTHALFNKIAAPLADKSRFINPGDDVVTGIRSIEAFGHSIGHMAYHVESNGQRLVIWADTCNHYVVSLQRPDWHVHFDDDKEQAAATRRKIFAMVATDRIPVIGHHMPFPAIGYLEPHNSGYRWVAAGYQMNL